MKWFKHEDTATNSKIEMLIDAHGLLGHGFYFKHLELIATNIKEDNSAEWGLMPSEYTTEYLCRKFKLTTEQYNELLNACIKLNLFQLIDGKIYCEQILERGDDYLGRLTKSKKKKTTKKLRSRSVITSDIEQEGEEEKEYKDKSLGVPPEEKLAKAYGDPEIDEILTGFETHIGKLPSDRKPRQVAQNMRQLINSFIKREGELFYELRGEPLTLSYVLPRLWEWYKGKDYATSTEKLETVKLKMVVWLDLIAKQLKQERGNYETTN